MQRTLYFPPLVLAALLPLQAQSSLDQLKRLSIDELMNLEVTSVTRVPVALAKAPSSLQVITNWEIRRSGATNIPEALRLASNLNIGRKNSHDWGISARGFNTELSNKLLVLIDGRAVYTPLWSGVRWDVQDYLLEDIDRIEVISGPGGSVWGANAVNGVISVTTKTARETQGLFLEAGVGNQLESTASIRYGGTLGEGTFFRVYAKYFTRDDEVFANGTRAGDGSEVGQTGFRLDKDRVAGGTLTFQGDYYRGDEGAVGVGDGKVEGGNLLTRWSSTLADGSSVALQLYYDRAFLRLPTSSGLFWPAGVFSDDLQTYDVDFQHRLAAIGAHSLVWGAQYRHWIDQSKGSPGLAFDPAHATQHLFSGFLQDQIALNDRLLLTLGTKLEHTEYTGFEVEPSIRLQKDVGERNLVWSAISRAVRTPSRIDRDIKQPGVNPTILLGGKDFDSETVIAYEAGFRGEIYQRVSGSISVFYNEYRQIRSIRPTPVTFIPLVVQNDVEGDTYGLEASFDADLLKRWRIHGGYAFLRSDLRVRKGGADFNNALNETSDPQHQVTLGSSVDLPAGVELDLQFRWIDSLRTNFDQKPGKVPSYLDLNARIGMQVNKNLNVSIVGHNLLDTQHPELGNPTPDRVEIRRSIFAKVTWRY